MDNLRRYALLLVLLVAVLACGLITAPATSTPSPLPEMRSPSPTTALTDTPSFTATLPATDTPAPTDTPAASETPNPLAGLPLPFMNLGGGLQEYLNPVGQPVQTWNGIPIMPEATAGQEYKPGQVYGFKAAATLAQGVKFYVSKISALGYSLNGGPGSGFGGTGASKMHDSFLDFYKGTKILLVSLTSFDSDPNTIIVVISTQ